MRGFVRHEIGITQFVLLFSLANLVIYHRPLLSYTVANLDPWSFNGMVTILVVGIFLFSITAFVLLLLFMLSRRIGLLMCMLVVLGNSVAIFFISSYRVILDKSMMGNVLNTRFSEASDFFESGLLVSIFFLGVIPCWLLYQVRVKSTSRIRLLVHAFLMLTFGIGSCAVATNTWLWIDEHSKQIGGVMLPWAYVANGARQLQASTYKGIEDQVLLPPAISGSDEKVLVILVIGESARAANFAFYGYDRPTNPVSESLGIIPLRNAVACATYTTASLRCILNHDNQADLFAEDYELLPTYLQRHGIEVLWRSKNWGEPPIKVASYKTNSDLKEKCEVNCNYDEVLLAGLAEEIRVSGQDKTFVVLHQKGSHGPKYSKRYPPEFEIYKPACTSVELQNCTQQSLVNAYDNSILYTDYFLGRVVALMEQFKDRSTLLMYLSDHGESLGESGLYLHGLPYSIAPAVQKDIPFLVWFSERFIQHKNLSLEGLMNQQKHSHDNVFHSILGAFDLESEIYLERLDIFSADYADET